MTSHQLPGFQNPIMVDHVTLSKNSTHYSHYLNIDKITAGLFLFWFLFSPAERKLTDKASLLRVLPIFIIGILLPLALANISLIDFDIKLSEYLLLFMLSNVLFTCVAEEAYFRGVIQKSLQRFHATLAVGVSGLTFGLAHAASARIDYILITILAGLAYALVYQISRSISLSILMHATLNSAHFVFFTYPLLK